MESLKDVSGHTVSKYFTNEKLKTFINYRQYAIFMALSNQFPGDTELNQDCPE